MAIRAVVRSGAARVGFRQRGLVPQGPGPLNYGVRARLGPRRTFGASSLNSRAGFFRGTTVGFESNSRTPLM